MDKIIKMAIFSMLFNVTFGAYHIISGILTHSWWLLTVGAYYAILSLVRFVVITKKQERFVVTFTGVMLMSLSIPLVGTVIISIVEGRGNKLNEIVMIAMAAYAFTKITLAIVNLVKSRKSSSKRYAALRNISLVDACVSIFSLQRSMLVSFGNMSDKGVFLLNFALGATVCITVFLLGLNVVKKRNGYSHESKARYR